MKFKVPTNWQKDLLDNIETKEIGEFYGKLDADFVGGGRASSFLPQVSKKGAAEHIRQIHKKGIKFNYLLNATCLGNYEWTRRGQKQLNKLVEWLLDNKVEKVTVAIPYLLELIKKRFPELEVCVSTMAGVDNVERAKFWEDLGADEITLSVLDVNRNFKLLNEIRRNVNCRLSLIANAVCLYGCPFYKYHSNLSSHASQSKYPNRYFVIDYCFLKCQSLRLAQPWQIIRSGWIRPEDLIYYEKGGIDQIKLLNRGMRTESLLKIVGSYTTRKYAGNLFDLFPSPDKNMTMGRKEILRKFKYFFHPEKVNLLRLSKNARWLLDNLGFYLDNQKLEGFLQYFFEGKCKFICRECNYCKEIADKALSFNSDHKNELLKRYDNFLEEIINGKLFFIHSA